MRVARRPAGLLCAMLLASALPALAQVYRSVDKEGRVIYSDQPSAGAEEVPVGATNRMPGVEPDTSSASGQSVVTGDPYSRVTITDPANGATVTNPGGNFAVHFELDPALREGDRVQLLLDGQPSGTVSGSSIQLEGVLRGEHVLELLVIDPDGRAVARASLVNFTLIRPNIKKLPPG